MRIQLFALLLVGVAACTVAPSSLACTGIRLTAEDGSVVFARTGEFGSPLDARFIIVPKGITLGGGSVDGAQPKTWTSQHTVVGINAHGTTAALDGMNEAGLSVAAFYFPDYAEYPKVTRADDGKVVDPANFVNYLLSTCGSVDEVRRAATSVKVAGAKLKDWGDIVPPFHWIATDKTGKSIVLEPISGKMVIHDNPLGVITNSPTFDWHMTNLRNFIYLNPLNVPPVELDHVEFSQLGQGSGLGGMPGDFTPPSRFVRATVFSQTLFPMKTGKEAVLEAFHVLNQFDIPRGAAVSEVNGHKEADITQATIAADLQSLKYYAHNDKSRRLQVIDLTRLDPANQQILQIDLPSEETFDDRTPGK